MLKPDAVRLRHMWEAAASALEMAAGRGRSDLDGNLMLRLALTHCLEILGKAASGGIFEPILPKLPLRLLPWPVRFQ
jgi:uncharacterized protein with HEPN domain